VGELGQVEVAADVDLDQHRAAVGRRAIPRLYGQPGNALAASRHSSVSADRSGSIAPTTMAPRSDSARCSCTCAPRSTGISCSWS
jgi:hypothetical protein